MKITAYTRVGDYGWEGDSFKIEGIGNGRDTGSFSLAVEKEHGIWEPVRFLSIETEKESVHIRTESFSFKMPFCLTVGEKKFKREDMAEIKTSWADEFCPREAYGIWYRLYEPKEQGPCPMIVYLHGGGESGDDNWKQLTNQMGAAYLAQQYPSCCVLAPQTPVDERKSEEKGKKIAYSESRMYGWTREYLSVLCGIITEMIKDGRVDKNRVYLTGAARGGGGAILALDVAPGLFAAAVPVCPRMTPEVTEALLKMTDQKIWISIPYADESLERNKYIVDGVIALKDSGNRHIHLTIYSSEELAKYGIGTDETMPLEERLKENHKAWILTYHNEHGILDWLVSQRKETKEERHGTDDI